MMAEENAPSANRKYDFVKISYSLAKIIPMPFWILMYALGWLSVLFPSYQGKDLMYPLFFTPIVVLTVAYYGWQIIQNIFLKIEKDRYPDSVKNKYAKIPENGLLFADYSRKKSYGKMFLLGIGWVCQIIQLVATMTMIFGLFIILKYLRD